MLIPNHRRTARVSLPVLLAVGAAWSVAAWPSDQAPVPGAPRSESTTRSVSSEDSLARATVGGESRFVLGGDAPRRIPVELPAEASLDLGFTVPEDAWPDGADAVAVTAWWESNASRRAVVRRRLRHAKVASNRWYDVRVSPESLGGSKGVLTLEATSLEGTVAEPIDILWTPPRSYGGLARTTPNVILVSIDTLRADRLGVYGYHRDTSPNIDRMAREGVVFRNAVATSNWTLPSHASLFTGLYPSRHGAVEFGTDTPMARSLDTVAELFWRHGYATAGFVGGVFVTSALGFDQGFERYHDPGYMTILPVPFARNVVLAIDWMTAHAEQPFFVFLHSYQVHMPYMPPPPYDTIFDPDYWGPYRGKFTHQDYLPFRWSDDLGPRDLQHVQALYDGGIRAIDEAMGQLLTFLSESGLRDDTVVVFTSDHGEEFKEHGSLFHHHAKLFNELVHVPLIVWSPGRIEGGRAVEPPVSLTDVMPTLAAVTGLPAPEGIDGVSLQAALEGGTPQAHRYPLAEVEGSIELTESLQHKSGRTAAVRAGRYKFIGSTVEGYPSVQLFDLLEDPGEQRNIATSKPELAEQLGQQLRRALREQPARPGGAEVASPEPGTMDEHLRERMRALGYLRD